MYRLPQVGLLAQKILEKRLNEKGYRQARIVLGLWTHVWRPITFTLCIEYFRVKYEGKQHVEHLMYNLKENFKISSDWTGYRYLGLDLDWHYEGLKIHISMLGYVEDIIPHFHHIKLQKTQYQPCTYAKVDYGENSQYAADTDKSHLLSAAEKKFIQEATVNFLYYSRTVNATILPALGSIATQKSYPT